VHHRAGDAANAIEPVQMDEIGLKLLPHANIAADRDDLTLIIDRTAETRELDPKPCSIRMAKSSNDVGGALTEVSTPERYTMIRSSGWM